MFEWSLGFSLDYILPSIYLLVIAIGVEWHQESFKVGMRGRVTLRS